MVAKGLFMKILILFLALVIQANSMAHIHQENEGEDYFSPYEYFGSRIPELKNSLVLTFDDGPHAKYTVQILDTIQLFNSYLSSPIKATFFMSGRSLAQSFRINQLGLVSTSGPLKNNIESIIERIVDDGHQVANHAFTHHSLSPSEFNAPINQAAVAQELLQVHDLILPFMSAFNDLSQRWFFRAPYGAWQAARANHFNQQSQLKYYIGPIYWDIGGSVQLSSRGTPLDAADWECDKSSKLGTICANRAAGESKESCIVKQCARGYLNSSYKSSFNGGIVLMHDIQTITPKMLPYLLRVWTGINPYVGINDALASEIENFVVRYGFANAPILPIKSLNDVEYFGPYDARVNATPPTPN
jgi:peptidoglycan/xylan/chitin deacetylase (PgdA/CDA1 family)